MLAVRDLTLRVEQRSILDAVTFDVSAGRSVAVTGPSGSGKTSLLNAVAGIGVPATGTVAINQVVVTDLSAAERAAHRLRTIGMVFQFAELLPELPVRDNVALPLRLLGVSREAARRTADERLNDVGLIDLAEAHPGRLSGGEAQRVGIARALVSDPTLILADEPTGALDETTSRQVVGLLLECARARRATVLLVTHDDTVAREADRVVGLQDGVLSAVPVDDR